LSVVRISPEAPDPRLIDRAAAVIRSGGLVAFPTETVYGLGANALDAEAVARIFEAKKRPHYNPLIAHVPDLESARRLSSAWPSLGDRMAAAFWPGPLTLIVPRAPSIPAIVTAGLESVAVRVPAHPIALALLRASGVPLAAPSANRFTEVSPTTAAHVARGLGNAVDLILDGGPTAVGIESTVVDLTSAEPVMLRPGSIPLAALEAVAGPIAMGAPVHGEAARVSPGMVEKHYSPRADLRVYATSERDRMAAAVRDARTDGTTVGGLLLDPATIEPDHPILMPPSPEGYARELYAALHRLDELGCGLIVADAVPDAPEWAGVRDRLTRASRRD
jgi:L-threonylcarbamoyladenylate synthase